MKKQIMAVGLAGAMLGLYSCKDNKAFTIEGEVKNAGSTNIVYLLGSVANPADNTVQINKLDSAKIQDGKFQFKHSSPDADLFKLQMGKGTEGAIFDVIAQNGETIKFEADLKDPMHSYEISGSDESEKIKEYNTFNNKYGVKSTALVTEYQAKSQAVTTDKGRDSLLSIYRPKFEEVMGGLSQEVIKFMNANKNSLAAFYAAMSLDPLKYEKELVAYADEIKGKFDTNPAVQQFIKQMEAAKPLSIGHKAPDFTINSLDGKPIKLSDYKGKYVMVDFWASWCPPCRAENPNVVKLYNQYKGKGLNILGISLDDNKADWQAAIATDKLTWTHASDLKKFDGPTEKLYHIEAIPSNFIIDPQGNIIAKNVSGNDLAQFLNTTFSKL
ncbi:AhpC/TSA family protein [Mucilaginibacter daejeonensis]|uniref:TlpA disulfide reductase family protein n=1 Tax=Mucilaginibacter daejeonensis TaxID=398049 RepID=UPI001D17B9BA|nr:TlpA disulfide reductase family protein [Mucilaginibacter daejeonensis]UEG51782.1 AhpC/TSA family protein [Mucilaginibacter daejeonensis]